MANGQSIGRRSGVQDIDALLQGSKWDSNRLTFSFPTDPGVYDYSEGGDHFNALPGFIPLDQVQQRAVRTALSSFASFTNLTFEEVGPEKAANADLRFAMTKSFEGSGKEPAPAGTGAPPDFDSARNGDVWLSARTNANMVPGTHAYKTLLHEIGHALGLQHDHDSEVGMENGHDGWDYTIMSYNAVPSDTQLPLAGIADGHAPQTPMMADIAALQYLYGPNFNFNGGNTVYSWSPTSGQMSINGAPQGSVPFANIVYRTIWDGGGVDTYDFSNYVTGIEVDLRPGEWSTLPGQVAQLGIVEARGSIANALLYRGDARSLIENATGGSGDDTLRGNQGNNILIGNGGNDTFFYSGGFDTFDGGAMRTAGQNRGDTADFSELPAITIPGGVAITTGVIIMPIASSVADENPSADSLGNFYSVLRSMGPLGPSSGLGPGLPPSPIAELRGIEHLTGSRFNDDITGNRGANIIRAGEGDDTIRYTGGSDVLLGEEGNDTIDFSGFAFAVDATLSFSNNDSFAFEVVTSNGTTVQPGAIGIVQLGDFENARGTNFDDLLTGNDGNNVLDGGLGNDRLRYASGYDSLQSPFGSGLTPGGGVDTLIGGQGIDTADFSALTLPVLVDLTRAGFEATVNGVAVADLQGIENLIGTNSTVRDVLYGDGNDNVINGLAGDDDLRGRGGRDTFVFTEDFGDDQIRDFQPGTDRIDVSAVADSFADLQISGFGVALIEIGENSILLRGVNPAQLQASDFLF